MSIRRLAVPILALAGLLVPLSGLAAQDAYRTPTPDVVDILDAAPFPQAVVSPSGGRAEIRIASWLLNLRDWTGGFQPFGS
ncbi:MAG: hypothetical protein F4205_05810, partial [Gemmatimonadetes bacterium]|nr:hypothetical protein [Gemmatimonadota bacterium]